jgi:hypothetical protein
MALTISEDLQGFGELVRDVRKNSVCIATFRGPDREANAQLFLRAQHMGELVERVKVFMDRHFDTVNFSAQAAQKARDELDVILAKIERV